MSHLNHLNNEMNTYIVDALLTGQAVISNSVKLINLSLATRDYPDAVKGTQALCFLVEQIGPREFLTPVDTDDLESMKNLAAVVRMEIEAGAEYSEYLPFQAPTVQCYVSTSISADELISIRRKMKAVKGMDVAFIFSDDINTTMMVMPVVH